MLNPTTNSVVKIDEGHLPDESERVTESNKCLITLLHFCAFFLARESFERDVIRRHFHQDSNRRGERRPG